MSASLHRFIQRLIKVEPRELPAAALSFLFAFTLMASYYVLRPVRDAMSSDWSDVELSWLWTLNFFVSAGAVMLYGTIVSRVEPKKLVAGVYGFFAASFLLFFLATRWLDDTALIDKSFYVWVSFFALFHISVFWSFMSDIFTRSQSRRLFGLFGAGAGIGAVAGPSLPIVLGQALGVYPLLLIAALMLLPILPMIYFLDKTRSAPASVETSVPRDAGDHSVGADFIAGFADFLSHRFLLGIGLFILLYTMMSSFVYFELKNLLAEYDRATRAQYWGVMDLIVNTLAILTALLATGRLATRCGLAITLSLVPAILVFGWLAVALAPGLLILVALQIVRRAGNYAITRPGREMLFTAVRRETRFRTKPIIDIVVYRGGDVAAGWSYTALAQGVGLGLGAIALVAALIALLWALVAVFLGLSYERSGTTIKAGNATLPET